VPKSNVSGLLDAILAHYDTPQLHAPALRHGRRSTPPLHLVYPASSHVPDLLDELIIGVQLRHLVAAANAAAVD
jgi:hypothetical protein